MTFPPSTSSGQWDAQNLELDRRDGPSIYEQLLSTDGIRPRTDWSLVDDDRQSADGGLRWAPGAQDGVATHHMVPESEAESARRAIEAFVSLAMDPSDSAVEQLERALSVTALPLIDEAIDLMTQRQELTPVLAQRVARWLLLNARDRELAKFAIAIIGITQLDPELRDVLLVFGRHDEFTLFVAVALEPLLDGEQWIYQLARDVHGWGRIHCVERLANTQSAEIASWMLREGFENSVLIEYLAHTCATSGGLADALAKPTVDGELLHGAGQLLRSLILADGAAPGIHDYADADIVIERYLTHILLAPPQLSQLRAVFTIDNWLSDRRPPEAPMSEGWKPDFVLRARATCELIWLRPEWDSLIAASQAVDGPAKYLAEMCNRILLARQLETRQR